jgi:hypothetical protein
MALSASLYDVLTKTLVELGMTPPSGFIQTMLLKNRYFAGYKFRYDGGYAILHANSKSLLLFDDDGTQLKAVPVGAPKDAAA